MSQNIVEVKNLTKIYDQGNVLAVDNISFNTHQGEIFALLGPNGVGKTTTISILSTLLNPTDGVAFVILEKIRKEKKFLQNKVNNREV